MDTNIIEIEDYVDYRPPTGVEINQPGASISISLYNADIKICPHRSYLIISGKVTLRKNTDGTFLTSIDTKKVNFINNWGLDLFDKISYHIMGNEIDSVDNPDVAVAMKRIVSLEDDIFYSDAG